MAPTQSSPPSPSPSLSPLSATAPIAVAAVQTAAWSGAEATPTLPCAMTPVAAGDGNSPSSATTQPDSATCPTTSESDVTALHQTSAAITSASAPLPLSTPAPTPAPTPALAPTPMHTPIPTSISTSAPVAEHKTTPAPLPETAPAINTEPAQTLTFAAPFDAVPPSISGGTDGMPEMHSDHESDPSDVELESYGPKVAVDDDDLLCGDGSCVVCFERPTNITLDPCGHANLCDVCVSRLVKRRCPTCRARAKKVTIIRDGHTAITKAVREVIAERKQRETRVLEDTLQIVFLGPEKVGKKTLVRKLISKYPLAGSVANNNDGNRNLSQMDVFGDGTDFSANATIAGCNVRLTVLRRTTLASRRMVLDDVRVLKPDVLVLCCSAHVGTTFDAIQSWDKVLRNNFQKPRVWALLTLEDNETTPAAASPSLECSSDANAAINAVFPPDVRPKGHYYCSPDETFSIGFRSLAKDIVAMGRFARDEEVIAPYAAEARHLAEHEQNHHHAAAAAAAGIVGDHTAATNLMLANNGVAVGAGGASATAGANGRNPRPHVGRPFSWRGLRDRGGHGQGITWSGLVNWLTGSHEP